MFEWMGCPEGDGEELLDASAMGLPSSSWRDRLQPEDK